MERKLGQLKNLVNIGECGLACGKPGDPAGVARVKIYDLSDTASQTDDQIYEEASEVIRRMRKNFVEMMGV